MFKSKHHFVKMYLPFCIITFEISIVILKDVVVMKSYIYTYICVYIYTYIYMYIYIYIHILKHYI